MIQAPIFHVNGDDPEAVVRVARLAFEYRQAFNKDVVIDLVCYRRRGHNEGDDPSMTNPQMYQIIDGKRSVRKIYTEELIGRGDITRRAGRGVAARLPGAAGAGVQGDPRRRRDGVRPGRPAPASDEPEPRGRHRGRPPAWSSRSARRTSTLPDGLHPAQAGRSSCWSGGPRWPSRATSTGASARSSRSARCCTRASRCACPDRTRAGAPSSSGTPSIVDANTGDDYLPVTVRSRPTARRFFVHDSLLSRVRRDGLRVRLLGGEPGRAGRCGRRSSATSPTAPSPSWTSSSPPAR